jgi:hypothetical protein
MVRNIHFGVSILVNTLRCCCACMMSWKATPPSCTRMSIVQDAEYFESKKSRRGGRAGGGAALGHNGASRARPAAQQRQQASELDPEDGAAVTDAEITALGGGEPCSAAL